MRKEGNGDTDWTIDRRSRFGVAVARQKGARGESMEGTNQDDLQRRDPCPHVKTWMPSTRLNANLEYLNQRAENKTNLTLEDKLLF